MSAVSSKSSSGWCARSSPIRYFCKPLAGQESNLIGCHPGRTIASESSEVVPVVADQLSVRRPFRQLRDSLARNRDVALAEANPQRRRDASPVADWPDCRHGQEDCGRDLVTPR